MISSTTLDELRSSGEASNYPLQRPGFAGRRALRSPHN